jgi:predicted S18 family serine protease
VPSQPSYVLRIHRDGQLARELELAVPRALVGRENGDVVLHDPGCSSRHAELVFDGQTVVLHDLDSKNGCWLGPQRVSNERMVPGRTFTLGATRLELVLVKGDDGSTLAMPPPTAVPVATRTTTRRNRTNAPASVPGPSRRGRLLVAGAAAIAAPIAFLAWPRGSEPNKASPPTGPVQATVQAVWFKGPNGPTASGGTSPTTVRIAPNTKDSVRVGVVEEFAGGAGAQWRTAAWVAAFRGSQVAGCSLVDHEFLVEAGGQIDGPSAGLLLTSTMVALLRGAQPRADTTMTGTINPDGSSGPVGGIVQKMEGAAKAGLKRFGFPTGARSHVDLRTGKTVDLLDAAKQFGLDARELHDVFDAYEFLTGERLSRPAPIAEVELDLDPETTARLRGKLGKWTARLRPELESMAVAVAQLGPAAIDVQELAEQADAAFDRGVTFERSDFLAAAYDSYVQAGVLVAVVDSRIRAAQTGGDLAALLVAVDAAARVQARVGQATTEIELQSKRSTGGGQINALRALQALVAAECYASVGAAAKEDAAEEAERHALSPLPQDQLAGLRGRLTATLVFFTVARTLLDVAQDQREFGNEEGRSLPIAAETIARSAAAYGSAAGAVLGYLESLAGTVDDDDYLVACRAKARAEAMASDKGQAMLRLAAGSAAFLKGAALVNRCYSLGGEVDPAGRLVLTNKKALATQLDLARQLAREAASAAKARVGFVPIAARFAWQLGVARREGDDAQKLKALEAFWECAFWCDLAAAAPTPATK